MLAGLGQEFGCGGSLLSRFCPLPGLICPHSALPHIETPSMFLRHCPAIIPLLFSTRPWQLLDGMLHVQTFQQAPLTCWVSKSTFQLLNLLNWSVKKQGTCLKKPAQQLSDWCLFPGGTPGGGNLSMEIPEWNLTPPAMGLCGPWTSHPLTFSSSGRGKVQLRWAGWLKWATLPVYSLRQLLHLILTRWILGSLWTSARPRFWQTQSQTLTPSVSTPWGRSCNQRRNFCFIFCFSCLV